MAVEGHEMQLLVLVDAQEASGEGEPLACAICFELDDMCMCPAAERAWSPIASVIRQLRERLEDFNAQRVRSAFDGARHGE